MRKERKRLTDSYVRGAGIGVATMLRMDAEFVRDVLRGKVEATAGTKDTIAKILKAASIFKKPKK